MCPDEQKHAIFKDINLLIHTKIVKTIVFCSVRVTNRNRGQGPSGHIGHIWGPRGAPKIAKK